MRLFPFMRTPKEEPRGGTAHHIHAQYDGVTINSPKELEDFINANEKNFGAHGEAKAMRQAAVFRSVALLCGVCANLPIKIKARDVVSGTTQPADGSELDRLINKKPNGWQKPRAFRRIATQDVLLRGNFFARKIKGNNNKTLQLVRLHPDRVEVKQLEDLTLEFKYTRPNGRPIYFKQDDIFHLYLLSLDGITGVTPITFMRSTIDASEAMQQHGSKVFENGARVAGVLSTAKKLGTEGLDFLKASLAAFRAGGQNEGGELVLEDGMEYQQMGMTSADAEWIEARKFSQTEIFMFFGIPPHLASVTEKNTALGAGIEEQTKSFVTWTVEDYLMMWEDAINTDLVAADSSLFAKYDQAFLLQGNVADQTEHFVKLVQFGIYSPNEVRDFLGMNPRDGGDEFYPPPNLTGGQNIDGGEEAGGTQEGSQ